jgi:hypothetical protein
VETISWKWNQFSKRGIPGSIFGLIGMLIAVLIFGRTGLIGGLSGLLSVLIRGFTDSVTVSKSSPNQGTKLSLKDPLTVFLITTLIVGLISGPKYG